MDSGVCVHRSLTVQLELRGRELWPRLCWACLQARLRVRVCAALGHVEVVELWVVFSPSGSLCKVWLQWDVMTEWKGTGASCLLTRGLRHPRCSVETARQDATGL